MNDRHYMTEFFPSEFQGEPMADVDLIGWLDSKLQEGKVYCGYIADYQGLPWKAIFLVESETVTTDAHNLLINIDSVRWPVKREAIELLREIINKYDDSSETVTHE